MGWRASALIIILVFGVLLSMPYFSAIVPHQPKVSIVTIPEGAQLDNFEPQTIKVVIGTNNTVRWINQDSVPSSVVADDDSDPSFFKAAQDGSANPTDEPLVPGRVF